MSLSDVDLRACRFFGAHGPESLSIEASCQVATYPACAPLQRPRDDRRRTLLCRDSSWEHPSIQPPPWLKGRDGQNSCSRRRSPHCTGRYGTLARTTKTKRAPATCTTARWMRRKTSLPERGQRGRVRARSDRAILTAYWLVCGYGLKASRALIALLAAVAAGSLGLWAWGFTSDPPYTRALLYGIESISSLFRVPRPRPGHHLRRRRHSDGSADPWPRAHRADGPRPPRTRQTLSRAVGAAGQPTSSLNRDGCGRSDAICRDLPL
jgi:hypothetical protein